MQEMWQSDKPELFLGKENRDEGIHLLLEMRGVEEKMTLNELYEICIIENKTLEIIRIIPGKLFIAKLR